MSKSQHTIVVEGFEHRPVFTSALSDPWDLEKAAASGKSSFTRVCRIGALASTATLDDHLASVEKQFAMLQKAGFLVVPHTWGLVPETAVPLIRHYKFKAPKLLPPSYFLAAQVEVIAAQTAPTDQIDTFVLGTRNYRKQIPTGQPMLGEFGLSQCTYGRLRGSADGQDSTEGFWLHDIEPIVGIAN